MNKRMAEDFFEELIEAVADGATGRQPNPGRTFNRLAREGALDGLDDESYASCLHATNELARLWANAGDMETGELLRRAVAACVATGADARRLAAPMASAWVRGHAGHDGDPYVRQPFRYVEGTEAASGPLSSPLAGMTAHEIAARLSERVWGQEGAVRAMALMLWHHARGNRRVTLLMGPTGSGKTLLAQTMADLWPDVAWVDGSQVSMDGWSGSVKLTGAFRGWERASAERAIVVIDEADKMFEPRTSSAGENVSASVQTQLLKLMDGGHAQMVLGRDRNDPAESVDMGRVSFLLMGTFEHMLGRMSHDRRSAGFAADNRDVDGATTRLPTTEDLERHGGVRREIAGRVNAVARVEAMTEDDMVALLRDPERSPAARLGQEYGIDVELTDGECRRMAEEAVASGLGVRSLESQLERMLDDELWEGEERREAGEAGDDVDKDGRGDAGGGAVDGNEGEAFQDMSMTSASCRHGSLTGVRGEHG